MQGANRHFGKRMSVACLIAAALPHAALAAATLADGTWLVVERCGDNSQTKDPKLKEEFEKKLTSDPEFAASPYARLNFFYERSPWFVANRIGRYPVGRLSKLEGIPVESTAK